MAGCWLDFTIVIVVFVAVHVDRSEQLDELGCMRRLPIQDDLDSASMVHLGSLASHAGCIHFCQSHGFHWALLQGGYNCSCSNNDYETREKLDPSLCNKECEAVLGGTEMCGSSSPNVSAITVLYALAKQGCYLRLPGNKDSHLPIQVYIANIEAALTNQLCASTCQVLGYKYAGSAKAQCYCGNGKYDLSSQIEGCTAKCPGDEKQVCGDSEKHVHVVLAQHANACLYKNRCQNGGTCLSKFNIATCRCTKDFKGRFCEQSGSEMSSRAWSVGPNWLLDYLYIAAAALLWTV